MKKIVVLIILTTISVVSIQAFSLDGTLDFRYSSKYMGGAGQILYDHHVLQKDVMFSVEPIGLYGVVWSSYSPRNGINQDFGDEIDFILGISSPVWKLEMDLSYSYYNCYDINDTEGDLHALVLVTDFPEIYHLKPYLKLERDVPFDEDILPGGFIYRLGAEYDLQLGKIFSFDVSLAGHDGAFGTKKETISSSRLSLSTVFNWGNVEIVPSIDFQKCLGKDIEDGGMTEDKIWYGISISIPFSIF